MLLLIAALACAEDPKGSGGDDGAGDGDADTGGASEPVLEALDQMPACEPGSDDGRLDIAAGCADGACLGSPWPEVRDALGDPSCFFNFDAAYCSWSSGLLIAFADGDADGEPDDDSLAFTLAINPPWGGGTAEGLALDATLRCFVDELGTPDAVSFQQTSAGWVARSMAWTDLFFDVYDFSDADGAGGPDGLPDFVQFTNYLYY